MAVEIVNNGNKEYLEVLYHFNNEKLTPFNPTLFHFAQSATSNILFLEEKYSAVKIHITKKLHEKTTNNRLFDMIIECHGIEQLHKKLFVCIGLEFKRSDGTFIIQSPEFETVFSQFKSTVVYQTKSGNFVFVSNYTLLSSDDAPIISISAKAAYKEIIEPDSFKELSTVEVAKPLSQKVETKTSNVVFKPFSLLEWKEGKEGFRSRKARRRRRRRRRAQTASNKTASNQMAAGRTKTGQGSYMECNLLKGNTNDIYEDVAVVPLKTNVYERGMVTFSHFLHFFLVSFGAGLGFPNLLVTVFSYDDFIDDKTNTPNTLRTVVGFLSLVIFFLLGLILMIVGLAAPQYISRQKNRRGIKDGPVIATVGFYFVLIHCSFALGMFTFKKFETLTDGGKNNKFAAMFDNKGLGISSFFDIMDGFKNP